MPNVAEKQAPNQSIIDTSTLDLSSVVGHGILLYSEQFPGQPLRSRVLESHGTTFSLDRSGSGRRIDNLVHNQVVTIQFSYRGERISVRARLKRTAGGKCNVFLNSQVVALTRRSFWRADLQLPTRLTVLPMSALHTRDVSQLRWIQVETVNFSSGGVLLELTSFLEAGSFLLMNFEQEYFEFPALVLGCVRHCQQALTGRFRIGLEFVLDEHRGRHFPEDAVRTLPKVVFEYNRKLRLWLNSQIITKFSEQPPI
jgi:hypothetical protein